MSKILDAFRKFKQDVHEMDNAEELNKMLPHSTVYDIQHRFSINRKFNSYVLPLFDIAIKKQPHVYHAALNQGAYTDANPQNQVLMHGILFNALFNVYMSHFKKGFNNIFLSDFQNSFINDKIIIDYMEYTDLPKRYHGIFIQYDTDRYILNVPYKNMIITYNKKNKEKLEKLLLRAKMLIPVIYKIKVDGIIPDIDLGGTMQIYEQKKPELPAFVPDSLSAKCVSDEQLNTIRELHDIFVEIAKITLPIKTTVKVNACDVYYEYKKEQEQKGTVLSAHNMSKHAEEHRQQSIDNETRAYQQRIKSINDNYDQGRTDLLQALSANISKRIR